MDDPWANAWGEPSRTTLPDSTASSSWTAPSVSVIQGDHEDDLSMPSWSSGPHAGWTEPDIPETSLWGADAVAGGWNPAPSSFDRMSLASKESDANTEPSTPHEHLDSPVSRERQESPETPPPDERGWKVPKIQADAASAANSPPASPIKVTPLSLPTANGVNDFGSGGWDQAASLPEEPSDELLALEKEPSLTKTRPLSSVPDDVDGFGVFETAHEVDDADGWGSPSRANFTAPSGDPWATAEPWGSESAAHAQEDASEDDAWEAARQQKAKQDLHVPPELLASILHQFEDLAVDLWPSKEEESGLERRVDFESIGLESIVSRLIPQDLTLSQNVPFPKTFTSKQVVESLRLTRHSACTRSSPMAFYMASKGSSSWEAALKSKPLVPQEDITPAGWKIVAQEKEDSVSPEETKKKPSGGLLSFFQRKPTVSSVSEEPKQQEATSSAGTPRASVDSTRSSVAQSQTPAKSTPSSPSVVSFASSLNPISETAVEKPPTPTPIPDFSVDSAVRVEVAPAPSAVSRFLGRFSGRTRTSSNPSMALSSDDLEFLADVPTAASGDAIGELDTDSLSAMIRSSPLPTKLPAPLAPPPRAPPQPTRVLSPPPPPKPQPAQTDDFMSFFDALPPTSTQLHSPSSSESPLSLLAPSPPPLAKADRAQSLSSFQAFVTPGPASAPSVPEPRSFSIDERASTPKNDSADTDSWPSFDYPVAPSPKAPSFRVATPSQPSKRPFIAVMASSSSSSSSRPPSAPATPPLLPKPGSGFTFPPPPSTQRPAPNGSPLGGNSRGSSPFPPPPSSRGQTPLFIQPTPPSQPNVSVDDDDFADFLSSPAQTTPPPSNAFQSFTSASTTAPTLPPSQPMNLSDSFDDFVDPLPPIPPAKNFPSNSLRTSSPALAPPPAVSNRKPAATSPPRPPPPAPSSSSGSLSQKPSRKADHSRTLSLMETAAARGRWLAPPSPLPEALPPPTSSRAGNGHDATVDFLGGMFGTGDDGVGGGASSMQAAQAAATNAMSSMSTATLRPDSGASVNGASIGKSSMETPSWTFPPPSGFNMSLAPPPAPFASGASLKPANLNTNGTPSPFAIASSGPPVPSTGKGIATGQTGGLSAQDLSFFEGL